jgi:hypothetical protein
MWMPTWLGLNGAALKRVEDTVLPKIRGMEVTEQNLDAVNAMVLEELVVQFPDLEGLYDYLDGLKFVTNAGGPATDQVRLSTP